MANYIPTNLVVMHRCVGFDPIDDTYEVEGVERNARVALYNANDELVDVDTTKVWQFSRLSNDTDYKLKAVYMIGQNVGGVIPDTEVEFHTKALVYYKPVVEVANGIASVAEMDDSYWMPESVAINGFGIGVELCDADGNILDHCAETPCTFSNLAEQEYIIRAYEWHGRDEESSKTKYGVLNNTSVVLDNYKLAVFAFPETISSELHVRLQYFSSPSLMKVSLDGEEIYRSESDLENKVYVIRLDDLSSNTLYQVVVEVVDGGKSYSREITFITNELPSHDISPENKFKDFWIAIGEPGAYKRDMQYSEVFGMNQRFGIKIKHAPYSPFAKIKNVVVQSWKDEDGDDVWLPRRTAGEGGTYEPAVTHEAVEYKPKFIIFGDSEKVNSNAVIRKMLKLIEGRWLKIWDEYTQMGFEGVYLVDVDDDPSFKRRSYDFVEFTLTFKINGTNIDAPFEGIG